MPRVHAYTQWRPSCLHSKKLSDLHSLSSIKNDLLVCLVTYYHMAEKNTRTVTAVETTVTVTCLMNTEFCMDAFYFIDIHPGVAAFSWHTCCIFLFRVSSVADAFFYQRCRLRNTTAVPAPASNAAAAIKIGSAVCGALGLEPSFVVVESFPV